MSRLIIVDGYNLLHALNPSDHLDLEKQRDGLIELLARYKRVRRIHKVICVFDAWRVGISVPTTEPRAGVDVMYSAYGQKADDVIVKLASQYTSAATVVSSDRSVCDQAEGFGCVAISSAEMIRKMEAAFTIEMAAEKTEDEDRQTRPKYLTKKRGNPKRPSKKERKRRRAMEKL